MIEQRLGAWPGLFLTGSGFRVTGIPDCIEDARDSEKSVRYNPSMKPLRIVALLGAILVALPLPSSSESNVDPAIDKVLKEIRRKDTGQLAVSEEDGRFLRMLIAASGSKRVLEIGAASGTARSGWGWRCGKPVAGW